MKYEVANSESSPALSTIHAELAAFAGDADAMTRTHAVAAMALRVHRDHYDVRALVADVLGDLATRGLARVGDLATQVHRELRKRARRAHKRAARGTVTTVDPQDPVLDGTPLATVISSQGEAESGVAAVLVPALRATLAADVQALAILDAYAAGVTRRRDVMARGGMTLLAFKAARKRLQLAARALVCRLAASTNDADDADALLASVNLGRAAANDNAARRSA
ncbi:MAG TPA: hypothetical protein VGM88_13090 [Kofleriaceae bacterium]|jgi:hypothetical protein